MFILAVYGAMLVWRRSYLPWFALVGRELAGGKHIEPPAYPRYVLTIDHVKADRPPLGWMVVLWLRLIQCDLATVESTKPWACPLCMSFLLGLPLYMLALSAWTMPLVAAFGAIGAWSLLDGLDGYFRVLSGSST